MGRPEFNIQAGRNRSVEVDRFIFLLLPGFSSLDLGAGIESLAAANAAGASPSFVWQIVSETGEPVTSSSGMTVAVDGVLPATRRGDCIVICGPLVKDQPVSPRLKTWLRQAVRFGVRLCGLGGGTLLLAHTGLAEGRRLSAHWKLQPAMVEQFPGLDAVCSVFEDDRMIVSCGGGASTLDLFSTLIGEKCGSKVASHVADQLLHASVRSSGERQTKSDLCRFGTRHGKLARAIEYMQANLEAPVSPSLIAEEVGLSTRQLERLFQRYIGTSPKTYFTALRLERARLLLQQTQLRVIDVAVACGFTSASHFSKLYRNHFGISPYIERGAI